MIRALINLAIALCGLILLVIETPNEQLMSTANYQIGAACLKQACQRPRFSKVIQHNKLVRTTPKPAVPPMCPSSDRSIAQTYNQQLAEQLQALNSSVDTTRATAEINGEGYLTFDYQVNILFLGYDNTVKQLYASTLTRLPPPCQKTLARPMSFSTFLP